MARGDRDDINLIIRATDDGGLRLLQAYQRQLLKIRRDEADFAKRGQLRNDRGQFLSKADSLRVIEAQKLRQVQNAAAKEQERNLSRQQTLTANAVKARLAGIQRIAKAERDAYAEEARRQRGVIAATARTNAAVRRMGVAHSQALIEDARRSAKRAAPAGGGPILPGGSTTGAFETEARLWSKLRNSVIAYYAIRKAGQAIVGFVREGIQFNQLIETATLGVASIITASAKLKDAQGQTVEGALALAGAYKLAEDQIQKIRIAGLQTAATTEQLAEAFQQAVGPGLAAGLNLDQIRKVTVQIVQAAGAIGVPFNQLNQEVRSILAATIDRNSRIAKTLLITNAEVKAAQQQNKLAEFLNQKLAAFTVAGEKAATTMFVIKSNLKETLQVFAGTATKTLFDKLKVSLQTLLLGTFDFTTLQIADKFQGILTAMQTMFGSIGDLIAIGLQKATKGAEELSNWFRTHKAQVGQIVEAFAGMTKAIGSIIKDSALFLGNLTGAKTESGDIVAFLNSITGTLTLINHHGSELLAIFVGIKLATFAMSANFVKFLDATKAHPAIAALTLLASLTLAIKLGADAATAARRSQTLADNDYLVKLSSVAPAQLALVKQYAELTEKLSHLKKGTDEYAGVQDQIKGVTRDLIKLNPELDFLIKNESISRKEVVATMIRQAFLLEKEAIQRLDVARATLVWAQANLALAKSDPLSKFWKLFGKTAPLVSNAQQQVDDATTLVNNLLDQIGKFDKATRDFGSGRLIPTRPPPAAGDDKKAQNQLEQDNRSRLEIIKADIAKRQKIDEEDVADHILTRESFNARALDLINEQRNREIASHEKLRADLKRIGKLTAADARAIDADIFKANADADGDLADFRRAAARQRLRDGREAAKEQTAAAAQAVLDAQNAIKAANIDVTAQINRGEITKAGGSAIVAKVIADEKIKVQAALDSLKALRTLLTAPLPEGTDAGTVGAFKDLGDKVLPTLDKQISTTEGVLVSMTGAMNQAKLAANAFQIEVGQILESGITNFFTDIVGGTKTVADAFRDMARSVIQSFAQMIAKAIAFRLISAILPGAAGPAPVLGGGSSKFASGGLITGPGSGTSDSIPARLSHGEYVIRAAKVREIGVELLDAINFGLQRPRTVGRGFYAQGGLVSAAQGSGGLAGMVVGLDEGLVLKALNSPAGAKIVVRHFAAHRNKLSRILR